MKEFETRIAQIRDDREHGSRWLVREAILLLRDLASQLPHSSLSPHQQTECLLTTARELASMRPAMAALSSVVGQIVAPQPEPVAVLQAATRLLQTYDTATEQIARAAQRYIHGRILTCSISGTVLEVLQHLHTQIEHVIVTEGRPRYEGRETARVLGAHAFPVTLITDAEAAIFLPLCDAVVVGADSILAHGEVINKAGTALLAWTAQGYHVPFYVLCESLKISPQNWPGITPELLHTTLPLLEEKEPEEVLEQAMPDVYVRNFYFDCTPYPLLTNIISEQGPLDLSAIQTLAATAAQNAQRLNG
jgi:translation initiation factor 2B subunit (eIF-2B alpha/beta/delta family)